MAQSYFPTEGMALTLLLVISDMARARQFYVDVLSFLGGWLLLVTGGKPTRDKPDVTFAPPADPQVARHEMTIRVPDCQAAYGRLRARGGVRKTAPVDWGAEIRAFLHDPDGHLIEISQTR
ncbi:MAG TPA: VOC family protein [Ktedonobacterales bacterium]|nr:VOC family protein [Ktedonobacterales bacterium]